MIPVGEWLPDLPEFMNPGATEAKNVRPTPMGYRPLSGLANVTTGRTAMGATCQGLFYARATGGSELFGGDADNLYRWVLSGGIDGWADTVTRAAGIYTMGSEDRWQGAVFGDLAVMVNNVDAPQKFQIGTSTDFIALGGSPPVAAHIATVGDFLVLGRISGAKNRVQWSAINNAEDWTPSATTQSDTQDMPDGGIVNGLVGGEYGLVFQQRRIRRMTYIGSPLIFQFDPITENAGCFASGSVASYENLAFCLTEAGFVMIVNGQQVVPIGKDKVDRYFFNHFADSSIHLMSSIVDPREKQYIVAYDGDQSSERELLIYDIASNRWSRGQMNLEHIGVAPLSPVTETDNVYSRPVLFANNASHYGQYANSSNLAAVVETKEAQIFPGRRAFVQAVRPILGGTSGVGGPGDSSLTVQVGTRDALNDTVTWSSAVAQNATGACPVRSSSRFHRARMNVAASSGWDFCQGVDVEAVPEGQR